MIFRCDWIQASVLLFGFSNCLHVANAQQPAHVSQATLQFVQATCSECHAGQLVEGGFRLSELTSDLNSEATFSAWVRVWDVVSQGKMPPDGTSQTDEQKRQNFLLNLGDKLTKSHEQAKGAVFRRLNRNEFENTLNDLFGTHLSLASMLPEDGRSDEFDNVGSSLNVSLVHMQRYMEAAERVLDSAIEDQLAAPRVTNKSYSYADGRDGEMFIGEKWLKLDDGAVVFFQDFGYPNGMLRESRIQGESGVYKIRVTGYAYQSEKPVRIELGGESYARGAEKPVYGYFSFAPGKPQTIEVEVWMETGFMVKINAYGIYDHLYEIKNQGVENYKGPGVAISKVEVEGPIVRRFPSQGHNLLFSQLQRSVVEPANPADKQRRNYKPTFEIKVQDEALDVKEALLIIAEKLFRRPVEPQELTSFLELYHSERDAGESIESAYTAAVTAMMCSPDFLFFHEEPGRLNAYAIANRLSYFLTRTAPDSELLELAASGELLNDSVLLQQMNRLLQSDKSKRFIKDFSDAWLNLRELDFTVPDRRLFPEFDRNLRESMEQETHHYLQVCLTENRPVSNVIKSDFAMLNERLAEHYGIPGVQGTEFRKVDLPEDSLRGGFLSQASVLKVSANGTNTSPVVRGVYVNERFLGVHSSPPPPNVNGIEPDIRGAQTLREILAKHRDVEACQSCHKVIDPPGFALESFNPIGGYREYYRSVGEGEKVLIYVRGRKTQYRTGRDVDASGQLPNGLGFDGFQQFRDQLASEPSRLAKTFVSKLLVFATGRELGFSDRAEIERIVESASRSRYGMRDLMSAVITSKIFLEK